MVINGPLAVSYQRLFVGNRHLAIGHGTAGSWQFAVGSQFDSLIVASLTAYCKLPTANYDKGSERIIKA